MPYKTLLSAAVLAIYVLSTCCLYTTKNGGYFKTLDCYKNNYLQDSLIVNCELNRSEFLFSDINKYFDGQKKGHYGERIYSDSNKIPLLTVYIKNISGHKFYIPNIIIQENSPCFESWVKIGSAVGTIEYMTKSDLVGGGIYLSNVDSSYFYKIGALETLCLIDSLNTLRYLNIINISPGKYWLIVSYQNRHFKKDEDEIWLGTIQSDTVWFDIVDNI